VKTRHAWILLPALLATLGACSEAGGGREGGAFGQGLQVSPDATLSSASYTIEGPNGFASAGTVEVGSSPDVPVVVSHLPVGAGYLVSISAVASDGATVCEGNTTFDVSDSSAVFTVIVHLECAIPAGSISVEGVLNLCPVLDSLDASPMDLKLGGVARLTLSAHDSDTGPLPLRYGWSVNGIKLTQQTATLLSFACSSVGQVTIAATVSDGDPNPACADTSAVKVNCQ
jgi:hypothetical protein